MKPVKLQLRLQPAPANLLRTAARGNGRSVYVPVSPSNGPLFSADALLRPETFQHLTIKSNGIVGHFSDA